MYDQTVVDAMAKWLQEDDTAYSINPEASYRAVREMLKVADELKREDKKQWVGVNRTAFIECLAEELVVTPDKKFAMAADRVLIKLYIRGFTIRPHDDDL